MVTCSNTVLILLVGPVVGGKLSEQHCPSHAPLRVGLYDRTPPLHHLWSAASQLSLWTKEGGVPAGSELSEFPL